VLALSFAPLLKALSFVSVSIMLSRDTVHYRVLAQVIVAPLSVLGAWLLVPAYGADGALWVVVGIEVSLFVLYGLGALATLRRKL
jgi:O-antigen/teichoic acid export membrane protein